LLSSQSDPVRAVRTNPKAKSPSPGKASCHAANRDLLNKVYASVRAALHDIPDGATIAIGGFGDAGVPFGLIDALIEQGARDLTIVANNAGSGQDGIAALIAADRVRKMVCSYPRTSGSVVFEEYYAAGKIELELVPQGTIGERLRAGAAGIPGFYTATGAGTILAEGKETRTFDGRDYVLERALVPDFAFVLGAVGDRHGNVRTHASARNFGPVMAAAGRVTIAEVREIVELGGIDPEAVTMPGIFVDRVVRIAR